MAKERIQIISPVELHFDPDNPEETGRITDIIQDQFSQTLWLGYRCCHITSQHHDGTHRKMVEVLREAIDGDISKLTYELVEKIMLSHPESLMYHFFWETDEAPGIRDWWKEMLPYLRGEKVLTYKVMTYVRCPRCKDQVKTDAKVNRKFKCPECGEHLEHCVQ